VGYARCGIRGFNRCAGYNRTGLICHGSVDSAAKSLGKAVDWQSDRESSRHENCAEYTSGT
jgi:hypothetical protein